MLYYDFNIYICFYKYYLMKDIIKIGFHGIDIVCYQCGLYRIWPIFDTDHIDNTRYL